MERRSNSQITRVVAILTLLIVFVLAVAIIATSGGGSSTSDSGGSVATSPQTSTEPTTPAGEKAVAKGFYIVKEGDTLILISAATGVPQDTILELNPQVDPQALVIGEKIRLR